jgi:diguanylate cyclase (GGDEF)-like protein
VLRAVAQALRSNFRSEDLAYRYGGEEFLLILRATSAADGRAAAERHRNAVKTLRIPHRESPFKIVTITMGIAPLADGLKATAWLEEADAALYEAKRLGRNQIIVSKDKVIPN